jgi:3-dehydroquinate dehydratase-2
MARLLLINGPNLNLLGTRERGVYGDTNLAEVESRLKNLAGDLDEIVDRVQLAATEGVNFVLLNPGAFTHTSIAIRDALLAVSIPFIEIHLSNVFAREEFRHSSYFSDIAEGCIFGLGAYGYEIALQAASRLLSEEK